ncbi:MAG: hypothetical protein NZ934_03685 [Hadesarchaea archaeon]|nr:hypothetical protein [Hadesarchaea archaeon]
MRLKKSSTDAPVPLEDIFVEPKNQKIVIYLPPTIKNILEDLAKDSNVRTNTCILYIIVKQLKELGFLK